MSSHLRRSKIYHQGDAKLRLVRWNKLETYAKKRGFKKGFKLLHCPETMRGPRPIKWFTSASTLATSNLTKLCGRRGIDYMASSLLREIAKFIHAEVHPKLSAGPKKVNGVDVEAQPRVVIQPHQMAGILDSMLHRS